MSKNEGFGKLHLHLTAECLLMTYGKYIKNHYNLAKLYAKTEWAIFSETLCPVTYA